MRWSGLVVTGLAASTILGGQEARSSQEDSRLFLFFSPSDSDLRTLASEVRRANTALKKKGPVPQLRPVLLVSDFRIVARLQTDERFLDFVKEFRDVQGAGFEIRLYDEEGLAWARRLKVDRTPAWALVASDRAHLAYGSRARIEEVASCQGR